VHCTSTCLSLVSLQGGPLALKSGTILGSVQNQSSHFPNSLVFVSSLTDTYHLLTMRTFQFFLAAAVACIVSARRMQDHELAHSVQ